MWKALYFTPNGEECESWFGGHHRHIDNVLDGAPMAARWAVGVSEDEAVVYQLPPIFADTLKPRGTSSLSPTHAITLPNEDAVRAWVMFNI